MAMLCYCVGCFLLAVWIGFESLRSERVRKRVRRGIKYLSELNRGVREGMWYTKGGEMD